MTSEQKPEGQDRGPEVPRAKNGKGRRNIKFKSPKGRTCLAQKKKKMFGSDAPNPFHL